MYNRILVPIDGSATSELGVDEAVKLCALTGARLRLLTVVEDPLFAPEVAAFGALATDLWPILRQTAEQLLQKSEARVRAAGIPVEVALFERNVGRLCEVVAAEAVRWKADLIVLGTHGRRGIGRVLIGSDAEQIVRTAPTPVLLVRAAEKSDQ